MEIIAHKGYCCWLPGNTMAAIKEGWKSSADGVEIDIRVTMDNKLVVIHDKDTGRITNKKLSIKDNNLADLLKLDFGLGERIPLLYNVLRTIPNGKRLFIELKCEQALNPLLKMITKYDISSDQIVLIAMSKNADLKRLRDLFQNYEVHWIIKIEKNNVVSAEDIIKNAQNIGLDGIQIGNPRGRYLNKINMSFINKIKQSNLVLYAWTVDNHIVAKRLMDDGVDGITTNKPELLRSCLF